MEKKQKIITYRFLFITIFLILLFAIPDTPAEDPIKIAVILSETGIAAEDNLPAINAAKLAVDEINLKNQSSGKQFEMILLDNQSTPIGSKNAAETAATLNVAAVIGASWSSHSMPMASVLQTAKIPMITPNSTKPEITYHNDYVFRICFNDSFQGKVLAKFALDTLKTKKAVVFRNIDEKYSLTLSEYFVAHYSQGGGEVFWEGDYTGQSVDFQDILTKARSFQPELIFIPGYARDSGLIVRQAKKMGLKSIFLGGDGWDGALSEYSGEDLEGCYYSTHWHPDVATAQSRHLMKLYSDNYGTASIKNTGISLTYDAITLLADALNRTKSLAPEDIRNALVETHDFQGATGKITFDEHGDPRNKEVIIIGYKDGKWRFVKSMSPSF